VYEAKMSDEFDVFIAFRGSYEVSPLINASITSESS